MLTQKKKTYVWGNKQDEAFHILKEKLCNAPVLALLDGPNDFVVYYDASKQGFRCVLMQRGKVIVYTSRQLKTHDNNYTTHDLELVGGVRKLIMDEAHTSRYSVHPGADKMYYDLRDLYWWPGMKRDIVELTKSAHFLPIRKDYKTEKLARIYMNEIVARHGVPVLIISDHDGRFTSHLWQDLQEALARVMDFGGSWDTHLPFIEFSYNNSYHTSIKCAPFEALYGQKCRSPVIWTEVGESQLIRPEIMQEMTEKIVQIKERLKMVRSRKKSYADKRRKSLEFKVGD
ncbi:putative reverse transcriptase domain-containing protein [Tanacetum coccineum]